MAKRMFSPEIVTSDPFLDMGQGAQLLYFHLAMKADDDGFVSPKGVMRQVGIAEDELKVLIAKRFILPFASGVVVVKHWLIHNMIRADLYKETQYKNEKKTLGLNENGAYTELREGVSELKQIEAPKWLKERRKERRTADVPQTARRLGKDRLGKDSKDNTGGEKKPTKKKKEKVYDATLPDWLDLPTWELWIGHRKDIRKPLTEKAISLQIKTLEEYKTIHKEIILKSIENGWTGLFPDSIRNKSAYPSKGSTPANVLKDSHTQELIDHAKATKIKL